jgi:signal transduction histidine kinase
VVPEQLTMLQTRLPRVLNGERVPRCELHVVSREATRVTLEIEIHLIQNGAGAVIQGVARDVTARLELEAQLRQAQKMEAIGRLASGIAHDFNNLATVVLASAERVSAQLPTESSAREELEAIRQAAHDANALTRQLLDFAQQRQRGF